MPARGQMKKNAKPRSVRQRKFNSQKSEKVRRAKRNKARRKANRSKNPPGKDTDLHHKDRKNLSPSSIKRQHKSKNRANNSPLRKRRKK